MVRSMELATRANHPENDSLCDSAVARDFGPAPTTPSGRGARSPGKSRSERQVTAPLERELDGHDGERGLDCASARQSRSSLACSTRDDRRHGTAPRAALMSPLLQHSHPSRCRPKTRAIDTLTAHTLASRSGKKGGWFFLGSRRFQAHQGFASSFALGSLVVFATRVSHGHGIALA